MAPSESADRGAVFRFGFAAAGFDVFGEELANALVCLFFECLPDFVATDRPDFAVPRLADFLDAAGFVVRAEEPVDFLRVFLDIRLPFVAFRGSIIEVLRQDGSGRFRPVDLVFYGLCSKGFRHATHPLVWLQPDDGRSPRGRFNPGGADSFSAAGIEGLFANIGFSGWGFGVRVGACCKWAADVGSVPLGEEG